MKIMMNNFMNTIIKKSLTELIYEIKIQLISFSINSINNVLIIFIFLKRIQKSIEIMKNHHIIIKIQQMIKMNKNCKIKLKYEINNKIYLNTRNL